jgi:hypothetical protein
MTGPAVLSMTITNTFNETRSNAQYIGDLNNYGTFEIALSGTLAARDKGDYYKFRVTTDNTYVRLAAINQADSSASSSSSSSASPSSLASLVGAGQLQYQVYNSTGRLIANSDPSSGAAYQAYQALTSAASLSLNTGTYTVKVSPGANAAPDTPYDYIFSMQASATPIPDNAPDASREEFQTTANPATTNTNPLGSSSGWLPTVMSPATTSLSMFDSLENYISSPGIGGTIDVSA